MTQKETPETPHFNSSEQLLFDLKYVFNCNTWGELARKLKINIRTLNTWKWQKHVPESTRPLLEMILEYAREPESQNKGTTPAFFNLKQNMK